MITKAFTSNKPYMFRAILDWLLDNDATPYILVDATKPLVDVPQEHIKDEQIVLNITPSAIQNWYVDESAISFNARFSGSARQIYVPMNALMAIYAQENGQGMAFPAEILDERKEELAKVKSVSVTNKKDVNSKIKNTTNKAKDKKISHLKIVK